MGKNEMKFYEMMHDQPEDKAEELSKDLPPLSDEDKKRIADSVMKKLGGTASGNDDASAEPEITVSGTEMYCRPKWYRYAASAAALVVAVIGIGGVVMMNRHSGGNQSGQSSQVSTGFTVNTFVAPATTSAASSYAATTTTSAVTTASLQTALAVVSETPAVSTETVSTSQTTETSASTAETTETTSVSSTTDTDTQTTSASTTETEPVTTTASEPLPFREGVWKAESADGNEREISFYSNPDGYGGSITATDDNPYGYGLPFQCEVEGNTIVFHIASVDNITRAEYTVIGEDTVTLDWDNGTSETLTYSAPVSNE